MTAVKLIAAALVLAGCAASGTGRPGTGGLSAIGTVTAQLGAPGAYPGGVPYRAEPDSLPVVELTPQILFQVLAADIAAQRGQYGPAFTTYVALAKQTGDSRFAQRATEIGLLARAYDDATQAARLWREMAPESARAASTLETLWMSTGRLDEVAPLLTKRLEQARAAGGLDDAYAQLQRSLLRSPDRAGAWALVERLSTPDLEVPAARLARAALAAHADKLDVAAAEAEAAVKLAPDSEDAVVAAARYLHRTPSGMASARRTLQAYLERNPQSSEARFAYGRLLLLDDRLDEAREQFTRVLQDNPGNPAVLFSLAQLSHRSGKPDLAEDYLKRYVELPDSVSRDDAPALLFLAQIAEESGRIEEALEWLSQVRRASEQYVPALVRRALLMGRNGRLEQGRELLQRAETASTRDRVQLVAAEAQLLRDAQRFEDAYQVLDKALEQMPDSPELLYDHGMAAERVDRLPEMERSLRKLIQLRPDYAHAYNALGYTFADRSIRLDEARQLIEKALELSPDDAHIVDSMGWVLYRLRDYDRAIEYLRKAYAMRPEAEIAAHLGEVLWASGALEEAKKLWREARGREPDNETLNGTLARLNVAL